ncbi:GNAT family N-acetyltransferase [Lactobacillus helveticus]|uniref:GNAT family N-acetyltransferase n=1 Tax=Lactobacillus helveticus TaxID=1587 RepID=A0A6A7K384_LACHE|nr:GNAT family N-acetyltransferase [Lactobacillus helveticus]MPW14724.1 GNAT family N-acetyltransferase [Lactobacillus helveticus]
MNIQIKQITNLEDINIKNEPFTIWGKMIPSPKNGHWNYQIEKFKQSSMTCFPDEDYQYDKNTIYLAAYDKNKCIGLAILLKGMFKYLYLDDLKVSSAYRGQGIGSKLIAECMKNAKGEGMQGIYTIAQDNNLSACLFYPKNGFEIGGFNNRDYRGTAQEEKADIYFYKDC